jgi:hypothetical protein
MADVVGHRYPEGTYTIEPWADRILRDTLGAPLARADEAHPLWGYIAPQSGLGTDIDGILAPVEAKPEEGTMIASSELEFVRDLRVGVTYTASGEISGFERKHGRKTGPFDLFTFFIDLMDPEGVHVLRSTSVWVLPRRESHAAT